MNRILSNTSSPHARTPLSASGHSVLLLCLVAHLPAVKMVQIAQFPHALSCTYPCGDADHNGLYEVYGISHDTLVAFEYQHDGSFRRIAIRPVLYLSNIYAFGDGDRDGRMEIIVDGNGDSILESPDSLSMPSASVWGVGYPSSPTWAGEYIDLDRDGHQEVALSISNGHGICLFENSGDNHYDSVCVFPKPPNGTAYGHFAVADFDRDSLMELVACGSGNLIDVFEGTGADNQYVLSAQCTTGMYANWDVAAAHDMDHNGWPEFIVIGTDTGPGPLRMMIFESTGHPHYHSVWEQSLPDFGQGFFGNPISVGDVDGDGAEEFAANSGWGVVLFKCTGLHDYARVWSRETTGFWLRLFDINRDGRVEVIFDGPRGTEIWEDTEGLGVAEFSKFPLESQVMAMPSVARLGASLQFSGIPTDAEVEVLALDGRLVRRAQGVRQSSWTWNLRNQSGNLVPAGTYFAVIRSKGESTSLKLCLVK